MDIVRPLSGKIISLMELVKFEHSIFALPFVVMSLFVVYGSAPDMRTTVWIVICMVSVRSASMAFNRIVDYRFDLLNPRTSGRPLQTGKVRLREATVFTVIMTVIFVLAAKMLNDLAFGLSFVALFIVFSYSFTKRFTWLSHIVLGLSLGLGPAGVWIAVEERLTLMSILLGTGVTFWVAGFDIIYAVQDFEFDRQTRLKSIPARFGIDKGLAVSRLFHLVTVLLFGLAGVVGGMGSFYYVGLAFMGFFLFYEHKLVRDHGLSRINAAFFTVNGLVSIVFSLFSVIDVFVRRN
jgi:4-hydroxybenzoate polyprenyltransferase